MAVGLCEVAAQCRWLKQGGTEMLVDGEPALLALCRSITTRCYWRVYKCYRNEPTDKCTATRSILSRTNYVFTKTTKLVRTSLSRKSAIKRIQLPGYMYSLPTTTHQVAVILLFQLHAVASEVECTLRTCTAPAILSPRNSKLHAI